MRVQIGSLVLVLLTSPSTLYGSINMKDASFQQSFIDDGIVARSYNSRSLYNGIFGFGWCSTLEAKLEIEESKIKIFECGLDSARELAPEEHLQKFLGRFHVTRQNRVEVFDSEGRLIEIKGQGLNIKIIQVHRPVEIESNGVVWKIHYNKEAKVRQIKSKATEVRYEYQGENLVNVSAGRTRLQKYSYDELHNMTGLEVGRESEKIIYDPSQDWVVEYKRKDGCTEKFKYERTQSETGPKETAKADVRCGGRRNSIIYEFWYRQNAEGTMLAKVRSTAGLETKVLTLEGEI